jgi:CheY-like chemotaxis protein
MGRILVVDDEPAVLEVVCDVLEEAGHEVAGIGHPVVTFGLISGMRPDMVLLDLMLPEMDGVELARRLRLKGFGDTPMVAMSASTRMLQQAAASGLFHGVLPKPFDIDAVVAAVERCLQTVPQPGSSLAAPQQSA